LSLAVSDNCTPSSAIAVTVNVTSDERPEVDTQGDGNFSPDAVVTGTGVDCLVRLGAERSGNEDGRVYLIRITATDQYNNTTLKILRVGVPQSQNPRIGICRIDSRPVPGSDAPDGGFFAESPPAPVIGKKQQNRTRTEPLTWRGMSGGVSNSEASPLTSQKIRFLPLSASKVDLTVNLRFVPVSNSQLPQSVVIGKRGGDAMMVDIEAREHVVVAGLKVLTCDCTET